jgi:hypothetical protein
MIRLGRFAMQNIVSELPPIPILLLSLLILVWIVPLLYTRLVAPLEYRDGEPLGLTKQPTTATAARRGFYTVLFMTVFWAMMLLVRNRKDSVINMMYVLLVSTGIFASIWQYRRWRRLEAKRGVDVQPNTVLGAGK